MQRIKQSESTAANKVVPFTAVSNTNLQTRLDASTLTFTIRTIKADGSSSSGGGTGGIGGSGVTQPDVTNAKGVCYYTPSAGDVNTLGAGVLVISAAGMETREIPFQVVADDLAVVHATDAHVTDIQGRIPAALVSGRIDASVGAIANNAITTAAITDNAITNAKINDGAITASKIADNSITSSTLAANAITAAKIATDAIGSAQLAAGAVTEIVNGVLAGVVDGTRTIKGVLARAHSLMAGKASGLLASTATFFLQDGTTKAFEFTQDTAAGTRVAASTVNGD